MPWKEDGPGAAGINVALRSIGQAGRIVLRIQSGDHHRSRGETNPVGQGLAYIKLLGQKLAAQDLDRKIAELQVRIAIRNRFTAYPLRNLSPDTNRGRG